MKNLQINSLKILGHFFVFFLVFALVGCQGNDGEPTDKPSDVSLPETVDIFATVSGVEKDKPISLVLDDEEITITDNGIQKLYTVLQGASYELKLAAKLFHPVCKIDKAKGTAIGSEVRGVTIECENPDFAPRVHYARYQYNDESALVSSRVTIFEAEGQQINYDLKVLSKPDNVPVEQSLKFEIPDMPRMSGDTAVWDCSLQFNTNAKGLYEFELTVSDGNSETKQIIPVDLPRVLPAINLTPITPKDARSGDTLYVDVAPVDIQVDLSQYQLNLRWYVNTEIVKDNGDLFLEPEYFKGGDRVSASAFLSLIDSDEKTLSSPAVAYRTILESDSRLSIPGLLSVVSSGEKIEAQLMWEGEGDPQSGFDDIKLLASPENVMLDATGKLTWLAPQTHGGFQHFTFKFGKHSDESFTLEKQVVVQNKNKLSKVGFSEWPDRNHNIQFIEKEGFPPEWITASPSGAIISGVLPSESSSLQLQSVFPYIQVNSSFGTPSLSELELVDLNLDGVKDIINYGFGKIIIYDGLDKSLLAVFKNLGQQIEQVSAADVDNDGNVEIFIVQRIHNFSNSRYSLKYLESYKHDNFITFVEEMDQPHFLLANVDDDAPLEIITNIGRVYQGVNGALDWFNFDGFGNGPLKAVDFDNDGISEIVAIENSQNVDAQLAAYSVAEKRLLDRIPLRYVQEVHDGYFTRNDKNRELALVTKNSSNSDVVRIYTLEDEKLVESWQPTSDSDLRNLDKKIFATDIDNDGLHELVAPRSSSLAGDRSLYYLIKPSTSEQKVLSAPTYGGVRGVGVFGTIKRESDELLVYLLDAYRDEFRATDASGKSTPLQSPGVSSEYIDLQIVNIDDDDTFEWVSGGKTCKSISVRYSATGSETLAVWQSEEVPDASCIVLGLEDVNRDGVTDVIYKVGMQVAVADINNNVVLGDFSLASDVSAAYGVNIDEDLELELIFDDGHSMGLNAYQLNGDLLVVQKDKPVAGSLKAMFDYNLDGTLDYVFVESPELNLSKINIYDQDLDPLLELTIPNAIEQLLVNPISTDQSQLALLLKVPKPSSTTSGDRLSVATLLPNAMGLSWRSRDYQFRHHKEAKLTNGLTNQQGGNSLVFGERLFWITLM